MRKSFLEVGTEGLRRLLFLVPSRPEVAQIEITNRCNFNCQMCQRIDLKVSLSDMEFSFYKKIIDRLPNIKEVILTGWGEPLIHPEIIKMIKYTKEKGKWVSLTSNGSLLVEDLAKQLIRAGLDSISFSVDNVKPLEGTLGHPVNTQIQRIENFMKLRNEEKKPEAVIQTTLHKGREKQIFEICAWAAAIGVDMVNVNRLDMRFNPKLRRPNWAEEKALVRSLDELGGKFSIGIEFRPHVAFSGVARKIYQFLTPLMARGGQHCLRVYNYIYVNQKGDVTPCCALPLWSVGNLLTEDLDEIWRSERFEKFRQHEFQRKICGKCDVLELKHSAS